MYKHAKQEHPDEEDSVQFDIDVKGIFQKNFETQNPLL